MHRILMAIAVVCFATATAAAQTKISGSLQCAQPDPQLAIPVGDGPDHSVGLSQSKCTYTKPMEIAGAKSTGAVSTLNNDVIGDTNDWRGFLVATMDGGDKVFMSYQGAGERKDGDFVGNKGAWSFTGGTGKLKGIQGKGTYTCSPSGCDIEGEYQLEPLLPPANEQLFLQVHAKGDQIYTCKSDAAQFTWTLKAPDAQLFDKDGKPFGKHFAGPSWEANDGSRVTGKAVASSPSPDANSIPWLLVTILSHEGSGVLSRATSIQRVNTQGGKAPASGCDASHVGQEVRRSYSADYRFYAPK